MNNMGEIKKSVVFYKCERCSHEWQPRKEGKPTVCPTCKSPYWNKPRNGKKNNKK